MKTKPVPPVAKKIPHTFRKHGYIRSDDYYWMKDRNNPAVMQYIRAENDYFRQCTSNQEPLRKKLFTEIKNRIKEDDSSVPVLKNGYYYQIQYQSGKQYPVYIRWKEEKPEVRETLIDANHLSRGHAYFHIGGFAVSPDNRYLVIGVDTTGRRQYSLRIKDLSKGRFLTKTIENTTGKAVWAGDSRRFFYVVKHPETLRAEKVMMHRLGMPVRKDTEVYFESDPTFSVGIDKSQSEAYIFIQCVSTLTTEYRFLPANFDKPDFKIFQKRIPGTEYGVDHDKEKFLILTNKDQAKNYKLMTAPEQATSATHWKELIPHRQDILLEDFTVFDRFLVLEERERGLLYLRIIGRNSPDDYRIPFDEETYTVHVHGNPRMETNLLRFTYNSMTTPDRVTDFNMKTREMHIVKEQAIPGGYHSGDYISKRLWIKARDGVRIPVSVVRRKDTVLSGNTPLLLYAYGAYGYTVDPGFSISRLSLLDRGFIFAIAHVRGGEYLGRQWYEEGKLLKKKNTFYDFIDVARHLIQTGYTSSRHLYAMGGSAGGLLTGAIINMAPELFRGVIAAVPFVDVLTTMLDDSIPLTTFEYDEWGNPQDKTYYRYIASYSPYDNVHKTGYPAILVTSGLYDSQVQYFEPLKWVAKLREYNTGEQCILLYIDEKSGHGGASGRYDALKDTAREYAFLLDLENLQ